MNSPLNPLIKKKESSTALIVRRQENVKEIAFHNDVILVMARNGHNVFIPHGETYARTGNVLYVLGTDTALGSTREFLR